jgi:hypothetical protein
MRTVLSIAVALVLAPSCSTELHELRVGTVLLSQEVIEDSTFVLQVSVSVDLAWASSRATLAHLSPKPIDTDDEGHKATAEIDSSKVTVTVEEYDLDQSVIKVRAKKYGNCDGASAHLVKDRILSNLERKH